MSRSNTQSRRTLGVDSVGPLVEHEVFVRLGDICVELLGEHAETPIKMLESSGHASHDIFQTCKEIEDYTRLLVDTSKAREIARRMREVLKKEVLNRMKTKGG